jgi:two-component sensor histidine kinase
MRCGAGIEDFFDGVTDAGVKPDDPLQRALAERDALAAALDASRQREELLTGAPLHRLRNMLALIRSIFLRTVEAGDSLEHVASHFPGRLDTLARYQVRPVSLSEPAFDLDTVIVDELMVFAAADDARVTVSGPEVRLSWDQAQAVALALHELTANSIKFGVLSNPDGAGRLSIGWTLDGDRLNFEWEESGVAVLAAAPIPTGFGREYIEQALPYQIDAETMFEIRPGGIRCRIALTVPRSAT